MADDPQEEARQLYGQANVEDLKKELTERGLATSGNKPELVERLLADDKTKAEQDAGAPPENPDEDGELCAACWPNGWPSPTTNNASCEHGVWDR